MPQDNKKENPGFFSVLLGHGTADLKGETQAGDEKRPFNEGRATAAAPAPNVRPSAAASRPHEQPRSSFAADSRALMRTSMSQDRTRSNAHRDSSASRPEQAGRRQHEPLPTPSRAGTRPAMPSMRSHRDRRSVDGAAAQDAKDKGEEGAPTRSPRKVAFNTPTHSLRKGKPGFPRVEEAGSSSDSSFQPAVRKPVYKSAKPKHTRNPTRTEFEERNWNSSTATLQDREESRSRTARKSRPAKRGNYPLTNGSPADGFQAVRVSGPDRVIIVPATSAVDAELQADNPYLPVSSTGSQRRPRGPAPNTSMQPPPMPKRSSQDMNRTAMRPADVQRNRSHRDRPRTVRTEGEARADREPSRSQSRPDKVASRTLTSTRAMPPMPDLPASTLLSQNMARARAGQRNAIDTYNATPGTMPHERPTNARARAQRA
ncbi:uncharacterized protein SRS1_13630 [Sporisorium reilianum f. sp. reilianum]|uniref:Uncharacterized protein n=1 Tax=Sporisorium reilianum f. sp. reilianum TaxID=72559 RepID=A0A2N8UEK7_9BASI|nr:uncharacterized protein SRS1_13630 [Sporisorium reilianum f. sp. reilianum]